jgi:hypothetical protein
VKARRLASLAVAAIAGIAATALFASPAAAHHSEVTSEVTCDINAGQQTVTWTITPSDEPGTHFGFRDVVTTPAAGTVTGLASEVGFPHANGEVITVTHVLPADFDGDAGITYKLEWDDEADQSQGGKQVVKASCPQIYTVAEDCNGITFTFTAPDAPPAEPEESPGPDETADAVVTPRSVDITLTPSVGDPKVVTLVEGGPNQTVSFPGSTGLTVKVSITELFEKTHAWTHAPCPLPLTGGSLTGPAAIGGSLLLLGAALIVGLFVFRRGRRVAGA